MTTKRSGGSRSKRAVGKPRQAPVRPARKKTTGAVRRGPTARTPQGADELKARLGRLATARGRIKTLRRALASNFHEIGTLLSEIEEERLHEVKGYGSFEAFLEREVDLGVQLGLRLTRIARTFRPEAARAAGLERAEAALMVLEGDRGETPSAAASGAGRGPALPPHRR